MLVDDVAARHGVKVVRTKIGEANVVEGMIANGCGAAGEGNGGVIYPPISTVRDGLAGLAIILEEMARSGKKLYEMASEWPAYSIVKDKISCEGIDPAALIEKLGARFKDENKDLTDGLKIIRDYGWAHLRASNTEPIIRCYAEAKSEKQARELAGMMLEAAASCR
jgi:phosphomannomutase